MWFLVARAEAGRVTSDATIIAEQAWEGTVIRIEPVWTWRNWVPIAVFLAWGVVVGHFDGDGWWFLLSLLVLIAQLVYLPRTAPFRRVRPGNAD